jgi:deoxyribonuclease-2
MSKTLSAIGDRSQSVDWWFLYKVPKDARPSTQAGASGSKASGYEYAYCDAASPKLAGSEHRLDQATSALHLTLQQIYGDKSPTQGYVFYNDEYPQKLGKTNNEERGHCKGVLAFDTDSNTAFWLLHSTPRFPHPDNDDFPTDELDYGQTFLCITLEDAKIAESIAQQMVTQQGPQTYGVRLPDSLGADSPWRQLAAEKLAPSKAPSDVPFQSKAGQRFRSIAKSRIWGQDLWTDLVGPNLGASLDVESWRRGAIPGTKDDDHRDSVADITAIDLGSVGVPYAWPNAKDHAKWAMSIKDEGNWACIADINRQVSQDKRGGGSICFQDGTLWVGLAQIDQIVPAHLKR